MLKRPILASVSLVAAGLVAVALAACGGADSGVDVAIEPAVVYDSLDEVAASSSVIVLAEATDATASEPVEGAPDGSIAFSIRKFAVKQTIAGTYLDGSTSQTEIPVRVIAADDHFKSGQQYVLFLAPSFIQPGQPIVDYFPLITGIYEIGEGGTLTREDVPEGASSPSLDRESQDIKSVDELIARVEGAARAGKVGTTVFGEESVE